MLDLILYLYFMFCMITTTIVGVKTLNKKEKMEIKAKKLMDGLK